MSAEPSEPVAEGDGVELGSPDSLVGLVQRGHGRGFLWALDEPALGRVAVVRSVVDDPRWDHQVEERAWFNAALIDELGVDPAELRPGLEHDLDPNTGQDIGAWLTVDTLTLCARRGVAGATDELRRYLHAGRDLQQVIERVDELHTVEGTDWLRDEILDVADPAELIDALRWSPDLDGEPWSSWRSERPEWDRVLAEVEDWRRQPPPTARLAHVNRLVNSWNAVGPVQTEPRVGERGESVDQLLAAADESPKLARSFGLALGDRRDEGDRRLILVAARSGGEGAKAAALIALGRQGDDALLGFAEDADRLSERALRSLRQALGQLSSPASLRWARTTAGSSGTLAATAEHLLADHGTADDIVQLRELLAKAVDDGWIYGQCSVIDGLHRLTDTASVPAIEHVYGTTAYSYLRRRCVRALADLSSTFAADHATEVLWDCEAASRLVAVGHAPPSSEVRNRLKAMATDPTEDESVAAAANTRV